MMLKVEKLQGSGGRGGTMSTIQEKEPEQVANSAKNEEGQEAADQQQMPLFTSSWVPIVPRFSRGM